MAITPIENIIESATNEQKELYRDGFKDGKTPLSEETLNLLLSMIKLNYDNTYNLNEKRKANEALITNYANDLSFLLDNFTRGFLLYGGGIETLPSNLVKGV